MAWIILTKDFDCHIDFGTTIALKASTEPQSVKRVCADKAVAKGCATEVPAPNRDGVMPDAQTVAAPAIEVKQPAPEPDVI